LLLTLNSLEADNCPDMAISTNDWPKITRAISDAILEASKPINARLDSLSPHGWRKCLFLLREWGILGTNITVIIALLALAGTQFYQANTRIEKQATFEANATNTLKQIDEHLKTLDVTIAVRRIENAAASPAVKESSFEARKIINSARANSLHLPADIIQSAGQKFVTASQYNPDAWRTALDILSYKSSVNNEIPKDAPKNNFAEGLAHYRRPVMPGTPEPQWGTAGTVPKALAAQLDVIGEDQNKSAPVGHAFLGLRGGAALLDGFQFKNVVFENVEIHYDGGPILLTNVYFINCTFKMDSIKKSRDLVVAMLSPASSTTFSGE
jgi:hypothetical protein